MALPTKEDFVAQFMSVKDKEEFDVWYQKNIFEVYMQVWQEYENGVRESMFFVFFVSKFFDACEATTQIMPGVGNMTIASYCNKVWRTHFLIRHCGLSSSQRIHPERRAKQDGKDMALLPRHLPPRRQTPLRRQEQQ